MIFSLIFVQNIDCGYTLEFNLCFGPAKTKNNRLTRCYTQHALRPFIDSESNHIRSFIKIPFINKRIDFIDLPSIFQDKSVIKSIPTYFQNSEPLIICYKYNKPIRNTIFNFNKLVSDLDIHADTAKS